MKTAMRRCFAVLLALSGMAAMTACGEETPLEPVVTRGVAEQKEQNKITVGDFSYTLYQTYAVLTAYTGTDPEPVLPETVENLPLLVIGAGAFQNHESLTAIRIPDGVRQIKKNAFDGCVNLAFVTLPAGLESLGDYCFRHCPAQEILLPDSLAELGRYCFYDAGLTAVTLPANLERPEKYAFYGCKNLKTVTFSERVTTLSDKMFSECTSLTEVILPDNVTTLGESVFSGCASLEKVYLPASVKSIGVGILNNCPKAVMYAPGGSAAETYAKRNNYSFSKTEKK